MTPTTPAELSALEAAQADLWDQELEAAAGILAEGYPVHYALAPGRVVQCLSVGEVERAQRDAGRR